MKLLVIFLALAFPSCITIDEVLPTPPMQRDWSTFERPVAGTPCILRVFFRPRGHVDFGGTWGDGKPYLVSFPVWRDVVNVVRVEVHYQGEVLAAKTFDPPITRKKGTTAGWEK